MPIGAGFSVGGNEILGIKLDSDGCKTRWISWELLILNFGWIIDVNYISKW